MEEAAHVAASQPDLVFIAFGMNDASQRRPPEEYKANTQQIMETIRAANADAEFVLGAGMTGNADWKHSAPELYPAYRDALAEHKGEGVAVADVTSVWLDMLKRKRFTDLTGNGVNHPNDFGHRVYA